MKTSATLPTMKSLAARLAALRGTQRVVPAPMPAPRRHLDVQRPPQIDIPFRDTSPDAAERGRIRTQGRYLARQDDWEALSRGLRHADETRDATSGGTPVVRLLAEGAHSDAVESALAAVDRSDPTGARKALFALQDAVEETEHDPWLAYALALAHLHVADAWDGKPGAPEPTPLRCDARAQHLEAAHRLSARHDPLEHDSPALASLRCRLLEMQPRPAARVADDYEDLIDLDPSCPDHMRAFGRDLMPARWGDWARLDAEARRTAARTADIWGAGAYTWVWFDALAADDAGFALVDAELFAEGLHDILSRRPDQHMANLMAAYCGLTLSGAAERGSARKRITECLGWIVQDHLREIHPDLWARARPVPGVLDLGISLRRGKSRALSTLAEHFAHQLRRGRTVTFGADGIVLTPSPCAENAAKTKAPHAPTASASAPS